MKKKIILWSVSITVLMLCGLITASLYLGAMHGEREARLSSAVTTGDISSVRTYLELDEDLKTTRNDHGETLLIQAIKYDQPEMVEFLLDNEYSDANEQVTRTQDTAMHYAVMFGHVHMVDILLNHDVDLELKNVEGQSAIDSAGNQTDDDADLILKKLNAYQVLSNGIEGELQGDATALSKYARAKVSFHAKPKDEKIVLNLQRAFVNLPAAHPWNNESYLLRVTFYSEDKIVQRWQRFQEFGNIAYGTKMTMNVPYPETYDHISVQLQTILLNRYQRSEDEMNRWFKAVKDRYDSASPNYTDALSVGDYGVIPYDDFLGYIKSTDFEHVPAISFDQNMLHDTE